MQQVLKFTSCHSHPTLAKDKKRQKTHLQLGQDFELVTSQSVLATVSVSGHSEMSVKRESVRTQYLTKLDFSTVTTATIETF